MDELLEDLKELREREGRTGWRIKAIEEELKKRGVKLLPLGTPSDATWERWTEEDGQGRQ